jgi:hypothetical protein
MRGVVGARGGRGRTGAGRGAGSASRGADSRAAGCTSRGSGGSGRATACGRVSARRSSLRSRSSSRAPSPSRAGIRVACAAGSGVTASGTDSGTDSGSLSSRQDDSGGRPRSTVARLCALWSYAAADEPDGSSPTTDAAGAIGSAPRPIIVPRGSGIA